jgi:hypothetical protein
MGPKEAAILRPFSNISKPPINFINGQGQIYNYFSIILKNSLNLLKTDRLLTDTGF